MKRDERLAIHTIIDAWPTLEPSRGFGDRVLAACSDEPESPAPVAAQGGSRSWLLFAGAVAVAGVIVVLCFGTTRAGNAGIREPVSVANAAVADPDLGTQRD